MKTNNQICFVALMLSANVITAGFYSGDNSGNNHINGGWLFENNDHQQVLLFADNYFSHTHITKKKRSLSIPGVEPTSYKKTSC